MRVYTLETRQFIPQPIDRVFAFFAHAGNLETITPKMLRFLIVTPDPIVMKPGAVIDYKLSLRGIPMRWKTIIESWDPPQLRRHPSSRPVQVVASHPRLSSRKRRYRDE